MSRSRDRALWLTAGMVAALLLLGVVGCSGVASSGKGLPVSSEPTLDAGRLLIESKCTLCHALDRVKTADHDEAGWQATVARMRSKGAVLTDEETQSILDYLASR